MKYFRSLDLLLGELRKIYGDIRPKDIVTIIELNVLKSFHDLNTGTPLPRIKAS